MRRGTAKQLLSGLAATSLVTSWIVAVPFAAPAHAEATIVVNTTAAGIDETDGKCSLAEAISSANFNLNTAIKTTPPDAWVTTECTPGQIGADTIVLPAGSTFSFTSVYGDLYNPMGPTALPIVFSPITIEGHGARLQRVGSTPFRAFAVGYASIDTNPGGTPDIAYGTGDLTLHDLDIKDFYAKGGNGSDGGGGGLGAGGAVYVRDASLDVERTTFEGNRAEGGNGGTGSVGAGGGGGGLGGNGGFGSGLVYDEFYASGGGGGGGARGDGGSSVSSGPYGQVNPGDLGGGGGGTVTDGGSDSGAQASKDGGLACGGDGGVPFRDEDGKDGCDGGGGGGGERVFDDPLTFEHGAGGRGGYGGGGGGGGYRQANSQDDPDIGPGGHGGFGGGGGAGATGDDPGDAGFGAGGGGGTGSQGQGGTFGGDGGKDDNQYSFDVTGPGGGGAGLGGAVFGDNSVIVVRNSTFTGNSISRGVAGAGGVGADNGADAGGGLFAVDGDVTVSGSTIHGNESTGSGAGLVMYKSTRGNTAKLNLTDTIVARNDITPNVDECYLVGGVTATGSGNLLMNNRNCPGLVSSADPQLGALAIEAPGLTPTLPLDDTSPAYDAGDDAVCEPFDQRTVSRPRSLHCDIGAYEYVKPSANLAVATSKVGTAVAGQDLDFLVSVTNNGPTAAVNASLTDTLPTGTTFVSITGSGGFSCSGTGPVTCTNALMTEGGTALLTLTVHLPATMANGTSLTNAVSVTSSTPDPVPANNAASVTTTAVTRADLAISKSGPSAPTAGTAVSYALAVSNGGPSQAASVVVSDTIPSGTTFTSVSAPGGWSCSAPAAGTAGPVAVSCSIGTLASGASASIALVVRLLPSAPDGSQLCNTGSISSATTDPVPGNNSSQSCGTVRTLADLGVTQTATTSGKPGKGTATFTVRVPNAGPSDSQNVRLTATASVFSGPAPSIITTAGGTCSVSGQQVTCTWTTIAAAAAGQVTISVPWRSSVGQMCMSTSVTAGTSDPNPANNTGSVCTAKK